jgi:hypothetical protein
VVTSYRDLLAGPDIPGEDEQGEARYDGQRWQQQRGSHKNACAEPPDPEHEPRQRDADERQLGQPAPRRFGEDAEVHDHEQDREPPQRHVRDLAGREEEEQRDRGEDANTGGPLRTEWTSKSPRDHRGRDVEEAERRVDDEARDQPRWRQVLDRPDRLGGESEERSDVMDPTLVPANRIG